MAKQFIGKSVSKYREWTYQYITYIPIYNQKTRKVDWRRRCEFMEIVLPVRILDPGHYLWNSALKNDALQDFYFLR
jgi:hypothetical protein